DVGVRTTRSHNRTLEEPRTSNGSWCAEAVRDALRPVSIRSSSPRYDPTRVRDLATAWPTEVRAAARARPRLEGVAWHRVELRGRPIPDNLRRRAAHPSRRRTHRIATLALW